MYRSSCPVGGDQKNVGRTTRASAVNTLISMEGVSGRWLQALSTQADNHTNRLLADKSKTLYYPLPG